MESTSSNLCTSNLCHKCNKTTAAVYDCRGRYFRNICKISSITCIEQNCEIIPDLVKCTGQCGGIIDHEWKQNISKALYAFFHQTYPIFT